MTTNRGDAGLRNAPRFHALFTHLEGRQVLLMPRNDWAQLSNFTEGQIVEIDIRKTPLARIATTARRVPERKAEVSLSNPKLLRHNCPRCVTHWSYLMLFAVI
jgi:hypothetical protein